MKKFNGYDEAKKAAAYSGAAQLPTGAYVCEVKNVRVDELSWGEVLVVAFDIAEGEQKDFFKKQFDENTADDKKWKGSVRINCPKDDGTEQDGWTKTAFARWINAFEDSNKGFSWDWDEKKLVGKSIGIVFGQTGTVIDGKDVLFTEPHGPASVKDVREGTFYKKYLELKRKNGYGGNAQQTNNSASEFMSIPAGAEESIPF